MQHLDDGTINELLDGEIASSELQPLARHLEVCAECSARLERARELIAESDALVLRLDDETAAEPVAMSALPLSRAQWTRNLAWAASLVIAAGVGYISGNPPPVGNSGVSSIATIDSIAPVATAAKETVAPVPAAVPATTQDKPSVPTAGAGAPSSAKQLPDARQAREESPQRSDRNRSGAAIEPAPAAKAAVAEQSVLDAAPRNDSIVDEQRQVARDKLTFDSVEIESNNGAMRANLAPSHQRPRLFRSTRTQSSADSLGTPAGTLFQIEGLTLVRTEVLPDRVRLIYSHPDGEVQLIQRRVGDRIAWHLVVPVGFPADTLRKLLGRVR